MKKSFIDELVNRQFNLSEEILTIDDILNEESYSIVSRYAQIDEIFRR